MFTYTPTSIPVDNKPLFAAESFWTCAVTFIVTEFPRRVAFLNPSTYTGASFLVEYLHLTRTFEWSFTEALTGVVIPALTFRTD